MARPSRLKALAFAATLLGAVGRAHAADPSDDEQFMLEMINRMRWDPAAELHVLTNIIPGPTATWGNPWSDDPRVDAAMKFFGVDPQVLASQWAQLPTRVAPLAWNSNLHNAAAGHNQKLIEFDTQSHQVPGEPGLGQRYINAGYTFTAGGENVYSYSDSVFYGHAGFAIDWGPGEGGIQAGAGHRVNIMNGALREVGIAVTPDSDPQTDVGPLVITQDFGRRTGNAFLTGAVYDDAGGTPDYFYTPGEGLGGVNVQAFTPGTSTLRGSTTTYGSGGYALQIAPGTYDVTLSGGGLGTRSITYRNVLVGGDNVKIDNFSSFIAATGGAWGSVGNWSAGVPNGPGTTAVLGRNIPGQAAGPRQVNVNAPVTVGHLVFDGANPVTVGGPAPLTLDGGGGEPSTITAHPAPGVAAHTIAAPVGFTGAVTRGGTGRLDITGPQQHQPGSMFLLAEGHTFLHTNAGSPSERKLGVLLGGETRLTFTSSQDLSRLDVLPGARATLTPGGGKVVALDAFSVTGGTLDLNDNAALVHYNGAEDTTPADVRGAITEAYAGGTWTGTGITSSMAAERPNVAVGYAESGDVFDFRLDQIRTFFDRVVDETTMLIRFTLEGDADLDGAVTFGDFLRMREHLASDGEWSEGDFDYDGRVTARDYAMLRRNFGRSVGGPAIPASAAEWAALDAFAAVVPEPGSATLLLLAGAGIVHQRRRAVK